MIDKDSAKRDLLASLDEKTFSYEKWADKDFFRLKLASSTEKGNIAEDFFKTMLNTGGHQNVEIPEDRRGPYNVRLRSGNKIIDFGVALATQDTNNNFQFNGIRLDTEYDYLFCLGILPEATKFLMVPKLWLNSRNDYRMVEMAKGGDITFKLTRKEAQLKEFNNFEDEVRQILNNAPAI